MKRVLGAAGLIAAAWGLGAPAAAREDEQILLAAADREAIVVTGARQARQTSDKGGLGVLGERAILDTPFSLASLNEALLDDRQIANVQDIARFDSAFVARTNVGAYYEGFIVRGFSASYLFDGLVGPFARGTALSFEGAERIDLIKGPLGSLSAPLGFGAGGAINFVPKRAGDQPLAYVEARYLGGEVLGGAADFSQRFGTDDRFGARANISYQSGETAVEGQEIEDRTGRLALDYRGEKLRVSLDLDAVYVEADGSSPVFSLGAGVALPAAPRLDRTYSQEWTHYPRRREFAVFRAAYDLSPDWTLGFDATAFRHHEYGEYDGDAVIVNNAGAFNQTTALGYDYEFVGFEQNLSLRGKFSTGPVNHRMTIDAALGEVDGEFSPFDAFVISSNLVNPEQTARPANTQRRDFLTYLDRDRKSIILVDELGFADDRVLLLLAGRYSVIAQQRGNYQTGAITQDIENEAFSPIVGLTLKPAPWLSLYASYAEAIEYGSQAPASAANANFVTDALTSEQAEIGVKAEIANFNLAAAYFDIVRDNAFLDTATNTFGLFGRQRNRGVELSVSGEVVKGLEILSSVSWLDPVQEKTANGATDGKLAPGTPEFRYVGTAEWETPWLLKGLSAYATVNVTGEAAYNSSNTIIVPGYETLDLGLNWRTQAAGRDVTARFGVNNVADERYWIAGATQLLVGAPRTFRASLGMNF